MNLYNWGKIPVVYDHPFWQKKGFSGTIFSQTSIAFELYDLIYINHSTMKTIVALVCSSFNAFKVNSNFIS